MCNFEAQLEWKIERISVSSYLDVEIINDQYHLVNPTPLDFIAGYVMEDTIGYRSLNRLPQQRLNLIDGSISSYCSILKSTERIQMIKQENKLASILCDIESDHLGSNKYRKKIAMEAEDQSKEKSEQNQMRDDDESLTGLETCEVVVHSVLAFGMDHTNNLKVKDIRVLLRYHFGSDNLKASPKKVELLEAIIYIF